MHPDSSQAQFQVTLILHHPGSWAVTTDEKSQAVRPKGHCPLFLHSQGPQTPWEIRP